MGGGRGLLKSKLTLGPAILSSRCPRLISFAPLWTHTNRVSNPLPACPACTSQVPQPTHGSWGTWLSMHRLLAYIKEQLFLDILKKHVYSEKVGMYKFHMSIEQSIELSKWFPRWNTRKRRWLWSCCHKRSVECGVDHRWQEYKDLLS